MYKTVLTILFTGMLALGYSQDNSNKASSSWLTYNDSDFRVSFPRYLEVDFKGGIGTRVTLLTKLESETDSFKENISVFSELNSNPDTKLEHYVAATEITLKKLVNNVTIIESVKDTINGVEAYKLVYSGGQGSYNMQWKQYYFLYKGRAYVVTLTSEKSSFDDIVGLFDKIVSTFVLK